MAGRGGVPVGASAVVLNVGVVDARGPLFVTVWACDAEQPEASSVNAVAGQTVSNAVVAELSADGRVCVFTLADTDLIVDVSGVFGEVDPTAPPPPPLDADGCPVGADRWSSAATWGGSVPGDGASVTVPTGSTIALDTDTAALRSLTVSGTLVACERDLTLTADWVMVHGTFTVGYATDHFDHDLTITLTGTSGTETVMGMGTRGLMVMGGVLDLHGDAPGVVRTRLTDHAAAGSNRIQVESAAGWQVGDEIAIAPTDYYGASATERFGIAAIDGTTVTLTGGLATGRWGRLQYATPSGMSLTPSPALVPPAAPTPVVLDERATVVNLTRNIVIQGADDARWRNDRFGAHVMVMDLASTVRAEGIEMRRAGQLGVLGRYPMHWHRLSYNDAVAMIGDATGHYLRNSSVHDSSNRCVTIHATNGVAVEGNVCVGITGHAVFTEDAVERRNRIVGNTVLGVRNPPTGRHLKQHEIQHGSSGFWISNPDNTVDGNVAADAQGPGFWLPFPAKPVGLSAGVPIQPNAMLFGSFDGNTTHSNQQEGVMFDNAEIDDAGNTYPISYSSTIDGAPSPWPFDTQRRFDFRRLSTWKNQRAGIWTRAQWATYTEFVSADNGGRFFAGAGTEGRISRSLVVGTSVNAPTPRPENFDDSTPTAFASYHSTFDMFDNVVVQFPLVAGRGGGAFATNDYYTRPVDKGHIRNPGNLLINSHPGYRAPRPSAQYAFAGALWDPQGIWGPAGNWNTYANPFLTDGATCQAIPGDAGAVSCDGEYYGVSGFQLEGANRPWAAYMEIAARRYNSAGLLVGTWGVEAATSATTFGNMRHFATRSSGRYELDFPSSPTPTDVIMTVDNMDAAAQTFVVGVQFSGSEPAQVFTTTWAAEDDAHAAAPDSAIKRNYIAVGSLQEVMSSAGGVYWQDTATNRVWAKVVGGLEQSYIAPGTPPNDDTFLYDKFYLRVH